MDFNTKKFYKSKEEVRGGALARPQGTLGSFQSSKVHNLSTNRG